MNDIPLASDDIAYSVLIDTWWNVNSYSIVTDGAGNPGFNRYMVERE